MARAQVRRNRLGSYQRRLIRELEQVSDLTGIDFWRIREYDAEGRTVILRRMKDQIIRGFVINRYALVDELLGSEICRYFFGEVNFVRLWRTQRFRRFNHYVLEILSLLEKLRLVRAVRELPQQVRRDIEALNALRNGLAHTLFPENLRTARPEWKGRSIFSIQGLERFNEEIQTTINVLVRRFYGRRQRQP